MNTCQRPRCWYFRGDFHCLKKGGDTCYAVDGENQFHCIFGGELCYIVHPSDTAPMLLALGASLRIVGPSGGRTVRLDDFFVLPDVDLAIGPATTNGRDERRDETHQPLLGREALP